MSFESTDPVEQFLIEVRNLRTSDGQICNYCMGVDLQDEIRIARILVAKIAAMEREKVIQWMVERQYATGHGDTTEDLLAEMDWQIRERERNGCLKECEQIAAKYHMKRYATDWQAQECIAAIKAREES